MSDERIITAAFVITGEISDVHYLQELVEKSKDTGTAYSGKDNLQYAQARKFFSAL